MSYPNFNAQHFQLSNWNKPIVQQQKATHHPPPASNSTNNNNKIKSQTNQNPRVLKLDQDITKCTYHPINSINVYESIIELLKTYHNMDSSVFTYKEGNSIVSVIELKGYIEVKEQIVFVNMMLPEKFPEKAPNVRVLNKEPQYLQIAQNYRNYVSKNDPNSIFLSSLSSVKSWNKESKVLPVMKQVEKMLLNQHPFKEKVIEKKPPVINNPKPAVIKKPDNVNQNLNNKMPAQLKTAQLIKQPIKQDKWMASQVVQLVKFQISDIVARSTNFVEKTRKLIEPLQAQHSKDFTATHNLQIAKVCIEDQIKEITKQNQEANKLLEIHDQEGEGININKIITPTNDWSKQLLELICIEKAGQDTLDHMEKLYQNKNLSFEQLLKMTRKIEEERFLCKAMIKKKLANRP